MQLLSRFPGVFPLPRVLIVALSVAAGLGSGSVAVAAPDKPSDGFYAYDELSSSSRPQSSSSVRAKILAGDYGRYKADFAELCSLVEADGRRMFLYQALLTINVPDRRCIDCRPFARAFAGPCRPAELRNKPQKRRSSRSSSSSEAAQDAAEGESAQALPPTPTPTPMPARLPSLAVNQKLLELGQKFASEESRNSETLKALDKLALVLSSDEGLTPGEREYGETFAAFLTSPFAEWREVFAERRRQAEKDAAEEASLDAVLGDDESVDFKGAREQRGTEGLFDH